MAILTIVLENFFPHVLQCQLGYPDMVNVASSGPFGHCPSDSPNPRALFFQPSFLETLVCILHECRSDLPSSELGCRSPILKGQYLGNFPSSGIPLFLTSILNSACSLTRPIVFFHAEVDPVLDYLFAVIHARVPRVHRIKSAVHVFSAACGSFFGYRGRCRRSLT